VRDGTLLLFWKIVELGHEPRVQMWSSVHHAEAGPLHRDDDVVTLHFDLEVVIGHPLLLAHFAARNEPLQKFLIWEIRRPRSRRVLGCSSIGGQL
jgi:hypothetical protein